MPFQSHIMGDIQINAKAIGKWLFLLGLLVAVVVNLFGLGLN
jgi:hypothetical protein